MNYFSRLHMIVQTEPHLLFERTTDVQHMAICDLLDGSKGCDIF